MSDRKPTLLTRRSALLSATGGALALGLSSTSRRGAIAQEASPPATEAPNLQGAGFYRFKIGSFNACSVSDGIFTADPAQLFLAPDAPAAEFEAALRDHFQPIATALLHVNMLYVDTGLHKVLIDNGSGPYLGPDLGHLVANLRNAGVSATEIDTVIISHAHLDHVLGTLDPEGQQIFPNAQYFVGADEWAYWLAEEVNMTARLPEALITMNIEGAKRHLGGIKDRVTLVTSGQEVVPGILAVAAPGHSPGMLTFAIQSENEQLLYMADAAHHYVTSLEHPEWQPGLDNDPVLAATTRRRILDQVTADRMMVIACHFPFPGLGHVAVRGTGFGWEPIVWQWS